MSAAAVRRVVSRLHPGGPPTDAELVLAVARSVAEREAAFAELVTRHGPMVLGACRRVLADAHAAEDAFQAVFLVLAQKADTVRPPGAVGGWLYGVAVRTARKAKTAAVRRRRREMAGTNLANPTGSPVATAADTVGGALDRSELRAVIDAELAALPEMHRAAIVLCDLQGKTRAAAAAELGRAEGSVAAWLARGRKALAARLARRGVSLPAAGLVAVATPSAVSAELSSAVGGAFAGRGVSESVLVLAEGVMRSLSFASTKLVATLVAVAALFAAVATATGWHAGPEGPPLAAPAARAPRGEPPARPAPGAWKETKVLKLPGFLGGSVAYSADGQVLFVGGTDGNARAYDTIGWKELWEHRGGGHFAALALAPDGKSLAITTDDGVRFLDAATGKAGNVLEEKGSKPLAVSYFPVEVTGPGAGARKLTFGGPRGHFVKTWLAWPNVSTIESSVVAPGKAAADTFAAPAAVAPDGQRVVVTGPIDPGTGKNVLWAWAAGSGAGNKLLTGHAAAVTAAAWSRDGKRIVTGDADGVVITWDAATFKEASRLALGGRVAAVTISADGGRTAAAVVQPQEGKGRGAYTEDVFVWPTADAPKKPEPVSRHEAGGPFSGMASLAFAPDGKAIASAFANFARLNDLGYIIGEVRVSALTEEKAKPEPPARWRKEASIEVNDLVDAVAVAPDGKSFALATGGHITSWAVDGEDVTEHQWKTRVSAVALAYSPDGKHLAAAGKAEVHRLDANTGKLDPWADEGIKKYGPATALAYSPVGGRLAVANGWVARVYPAAGGKSGFGLSIRATGEGPVLPSAIAWAPDGKRLAVAQRSEKAGWGVALGTGEPADDVFLAGSVATITAVAWSADGKTIAAGSSGVGEAAKDQQNGNLILWDAATGKERHRVAFRGRDGGPTEVHALAVSPDSKTVAVAVRLGSGKSADRVILVDAATGAEVEALFAGAEKVTRLAFSPSGTRLYGATRAREGGTGEKAGGLTVWQRKP